MIYHIKDAATFHCFLLSMSQPSEFLHLFPLQPDLCFILLSGKTGNPLGGPVKYSINGEGKLIGPQAHITRRGAIYILFGFGKLESLAFSTSF